MENKKINWYPGHMFKAKKEIQQNLKSVDAIIEVIDSRVPLTSHNKMLEEIVKNKPKLLIFSKADLVNPKELDRFIKKYENLGYETLSLNIHENNNKKIIKKIKQICQPLIEKNEAKGIYKNLRLMIIGMPNVGKSTLINSMAGKKKLVVGNRPGVTKAQQIIKVDDNIELVDTPGVLIPKIDKLEQGYNLVLNSLIKDEVVELQDIGFYLLKYLLNNKLDELINRYPKLKEVQIKGNELDLYTTEKIYEAIAKSIGVYKKNEIDYEKVTTRIINDYRQQKFGKIILEKIESYE